METHVLYYGTSLESFFRTCNDATGPATVRLPAGHLLYSRPFEEVAFGLDLLREAIFRYERRHGVAPEKSKAQIPFFRNDRFKPVGPDEEIYTLSLYERPPLPTGSQTTLCLELDYEVLAETCLFDTISLCRCEYDAEAFIASFLAQLENGEYDKFDYDEEHSGFAKGSQLIPFIFRACSLVKDGRFREEKEWRMCVFKTVGEARFSYEHGRIIPYFDLDFPKEALKSVVVCPAAGATSDIDLLKITGALKMLLEKKGFSATCRSQVGRNS